MKKSKIFNYIIFSVIAALILTSCGKKMSNDELKNDFFYIEDQYANTLNHYENDDYDEDGLSGEFPKHANKAIKNINNKIETLKDNDTTESKLIAKYGTLEKKSLSKMIDKHRLEKSIPLKDENAQLSKKISKKYFDGTHSKKMNLINSTYYAVKNWSGISLSKPSFTVNDDTGFVEISGNAEPNKLLRIYGDNGFSDHSTRINAKGYFKLRVFYPKSSDTDIVINYYKKGVDMPIHGNVKYSNTYANKYAAEHPKKKVKKETQNYPTYDTQQNSQNSDTTSEEKSVKKVTSEDKAALRKANDYSDVMHMSKQGIYEQLVSDVEGFPAEAAQYAIDNIDADWNANALAKAKEYRKEMSMSDNDIYEQLVSSSGESFTPDQASYAVQHLN